MTADEFRRSALKLFGPEPGWQSRCAEKLGIDRASVSRYVANQVPVPGPVAAAVACWLTVLKEIGRKPHQFP